MNNKMFILIDDAFDGMRFRISKYDNSFKSDYILSSESDFISSVDPRDILEADAIHLSGELELIEDFIYHNPILKEYPLVIDNMSELDYLKAYNLKENFSELDDIRINVEGDSKLLTIDKYYDASVELNRIINSINSYGFTPFEKLLYIYRYVGFSFRSDFMNGEDDEYPTDISDIILEHKYNFKCAPALLDLLLKKTGFDTMLCCYDKNNKYDYGKSNPYYRNMVYLTDAEYDIDGIYFLDPVAEMCTSTNFLFFGKTKSQIEAADYENSRKNLYFPVDPSIMYSYIEDTDNRTLRGMISKLARLVDNDNMLILSYMIGTVSEEEFVERIRKYERLLNKPLDPVKMLDGNKSIDKKVGVKPCSSYKYFSELKREFGTCKRKRK